MVQTPRRSQNTPTRSRIIFPTRKTHSDKIIFSSSLGPSPTPSPQHPKNKCQGINVYHPCFESSHYGQFVDGMTHLQLRHSGSISWMYGQSNYDRSEGLPRSGYLIPAHVGDGGGVGWGCSAVVAVAEGGSYEEI